MVRKLETFILIDIPEVNNWRIGVDLGILDVAQDIRLKHITIFLCDYNGKFYLLNINKEDYP